MRISKRERQILKVMNSNVGRGVPIEALMKKVHPRKGSDPKNFRTSVTVTIAKLRRKLDVLGVDLQLVSKIGRGHKAVYQLSSAFNQSEWRG